MTKPWLVRILVCLILGAITTVAVAWGSAAFNGKAIGAYTEFVPTPAEIDDAFSLSGIGLYSGALRTAEAVVFRWRTLKLRHVWCEVEASTEVRSYELFAGFPMLALKGKLVDSHSPNPQPPNYVDAISIRGNQSHFVAFFAGGRILPLRPVTPGFLIDTLFYAAIWFGVFFGFASAKRAIRRKRGRCPRCGYDLRGQLDAGCPECGWNREETATSAQSEIKRTD